MPSLQNLRFATEIFTKLPAFKHEKFSDSSEYVLEILLHLRDMEKEGKINCFCSDLFETTKFLNDESNDDIVKFLKTISSVTEADKEISKFHIPVTESMIPFISEISKYHGLKIYTKKIFYENEGDHYLFDLGPDSTIRYDDEGKLFREIEMTPVGSEESVRCVTPDILSRMSELLSSPLPEFVAAEPDEDTLKKLSGQSVTFKPIGEGVARSPESPPLSYSAVAGRKGSDPVVSPMVSIPEEKEPEPEPEPEPEFLKGKIYIFQGKNGTGAFINHVKINDKKFSRKIDEKEVVVDSIFLSRFIGLDQLSGKIARIPRDYVGFNLHNEKQFYPGRGFMDNLQVEDEDGSWTFVKLQ